ncbi:MAG: hypothetical protein M1816_004239 [Peltula sp. TS41687]|nr:MAG: hypothetical protein M1816_004239 [Peltula sp. TS41687]
MSSTRVYSMEEVLNLTIKDAQKADFVGVKIKDWRELTSEKRDRCILKLRDLGRQRHELAHQVDRSRSATPVLPPWEPDDLEGIEKAAYEALINDNGRPCYPIELGFDNFKKPRQYKDILEYWQEGDLSDRLILSAQLFRWKSFRARQQGNRHYYVPRNRFHELQEFLLERRRRHGLNGDLQLREEPTEQSKLDD